jgi:nitric oxide reductase NorE protein
MTHSEARLEAELPEFLGGSHNAGYGLVSRRPEKPPSGHIPGEAGLWILLLGDMTLFAAILLAFLWERRSQPEVFTEAARQLIQPIGAVNTMILLLSSFLVVQALFAHRGAQYVHARRLGAGAIGCAAAFAGLKAIEYHAELSAGHTPASGRFFTFYFILTGLHLLHVIVGTALLTAWQSMLKRQRAWGSVQRVAEGIASYWHMVDLLWVAIFALVYLASAE